MRKLWFALLLSGSFLLAQDSSPRTTSQHKSKESKGEVTLQGCVSRSSGDYILIKQDPAMTYELQATGKIKLRKYLGQRVEVIGQGITVDDDQFRLLNQNGRSLVADVDHHLDQDYREGVLGSLSLSAVDFRRGSP